MKALKQVTQMTTQELREEVDAIIMTRGVSRDLAVLAEAASRVLCLLLSRSPDE